MEAVTGLVKTTLPKYLKGLPLPNTFEGFLQLSGDQWIRLIPFMLTIAILIYSVVRLILPGGKSKQPMNLTIRKDNPKVVDLVEIEDLHKEKISYCRCWKSSKFPYCDGSHNKHNEETGDNVGPLVLKRKEK